MGCGASKNGKDKEHIKVQVQCQAIVKYIQKPNKRDFHDFYKVIDDLDADEYGEKKKVLHISSESYRLARVLLRANPLINCAKIHKLPILDHPNLMKIYGVHHNPNDEDNELYVITEYFEGRTLYEEVALCKSFSESKVATLMKQILLGLTFAHSNKIYHLNLKPDNIMVDTDKKGEKFVKIIDLGFKQTLYSTLKYSEDSSANPMYFAPEIIKNKKISEKSDIWSCGVIMFSMLSGELPFFAKTKNDLLTQIRNFKLSTQMFQGAIWNCISEEAKKCVKDMLNPNPKKRLSARKLLENLWILSAKNIAMSQRTETRLINNIKKFNSQYMLQSAACKFIATNLTLENEVKEITQLFQKLEHSLNGKISIKDLVKEMKNVMLTFAADMKPEELYERLDMNKDGEISYSDLIAISLDPQKIKNENNLKAAFQYFDQNNDGVITAQEIVDALSSFGHVIDAKMTAQLFKEFEAKSRKALTFDEFKEAMVNSVNSPREKE